jgi:hypothetical protein
MLVSSTRGAGEKNNFAATADVRTPLENNIKDTSLAVYWNRFGLSPAIFFLVDFLAITDI